MNDTTKIRVLCVDDHPVVRDGIAAIINLQPDMTVTGVPASDTLNVNPPLRSSIVETTA